MNPYLLIRYVLLFSKFTIDSVTLLSDVIVVSNNNISKEVLSIPKSDNLSLSTVSIFHFPPDIICCIHSLVSLSLD